MSIQQNGISGPRLAALKILCGCPDGATLHALRLHGIAEAVLYELAKRKLVRVAMQNVGAGKLRFDVERFWISDTGRQQFAAHWGLPCAAE